MTFDPILRQTVSARIRMQVLRHIVTGEFAPGSRIPTERELSEQFRAARTSVREAMQGLLSLGVIERRGNRTFVSELLPDVSVSVGNGDKSVMKQLFETRRLLEVGIFALAAKRSDPQDHAAVRALMEELDQPLQVNDFRQLNRELHGTIASASGNPVLAELYRKVFDELLRRMKVESRVADGSVRTTTEANFEKEGEAHREIVAAFVSNDPAAMERAVVGHLDTVGRVVVADGE